MSYNLDRQNKKAARFRRLRAAALVVVCAFGAVTNAAAQRVNPPTTPAQITPPAGNSAFMVGHAHGTQGYVCLPQGGGASWTVNGARPEATLFTDFFGQQVEIITHFLSPDTDPNAPLPVPFASPTWQSTLDSSKVWAKVVQQPVTAGTDQSSCPNAGAIACLLLQNAGSEAGATGGKIMNRVTFIQRLNTKGGSAPADGCSTSADVGKQTLVPYAADYYFFRADEE